MDNKKEKKFIKLPTYPGGKQAFQEYIRKNMTYPKEALENRIEGTVYVSYRVSGPGKVIDAEITHGIGYGCDEEAIRLVMSLKYEKARNRGVRVIANMRTRISFKLPAPKTISYNYTTKKDEKSTTKTPKPTSPITYDYTITID
nr:energy transducer TonB [Bacteroidota bacterium]